ncbi:hypothetical protein C9374_005791 [Naegleria lovaniensis]|uniref:Uncharacterized protein n=1 Tax=Naegleria lovaniensis TaxID=51637 RepID=A0AA88GN26_NAELO|nr:uncharacterized protein C9374_005791 [Naegleria lovaniensis]KAG2381999.1 hypothetical protein C9374_005791 [Naegleria lovaniensis]
MSFANTSRSLLSSCFASSLLFKTSHHQVFRKGFLLAASSNITQQFKLIQQSTFHHSGAIKHFSTYGNKLQIDPITAIAKEAEKYAPKNVLQIEDRIYQIETELNYNQNNISEQALCDIYDELSDLYCKIFMYEKAERALAQYIPLATKIFGENSVKTGEAYHKLSMINVAVDKLKLAYQHQSKCIEIKTKAFLEAQKSLSKQEITEYSFDLSSEWNYLGEIALKQSNLADAKKTFQKAIKLFEQTINPIYKKDEREIRNEYEQAKNLSKPFMELKDVQKKESKEYAEYKSKLPKSNIHELEFVPINLLKALDNLGTVYYRMKEYEDAYFTFNKLVQFQDYFVKLENDSSSVTISEDAFEIIGNVYLNMAHCAMYLEMPDKAEELYQYAIEFIQKVLGEKHPKIGSLYYSLGVLHASRGDLKHCEDFTRKALEIFSETDANVDLSHAEQIRKLVETGKCYLTLGTIYLNRKDFFNAENFFKTSLDIHNTMKSAGSQDTNTTFDIAFILNSLGKISEEKNLPEEALAYYQKAYIIAKSIQDGNNHVVATALMNIGKFFFHQGNYEEAEKHFLASYKAYDASFPTQYHPDVGDLCLELGKTYIKLNMNEKAKRKFEEARDVYLGYENPLSQKLDTIFNEIKNASQLVEQDLEKRKHQDLSGKDKEKLDQDIDFERHRDQDNQVREKLVHLKRKQMEMEANKQ